MPGILPALVLFAASLNSTAAEPADEAALVASGKKQFMRCSACHTMQAGGSSELGPHLEGIVGREVAALSDFAYTEELREEQFIWDEARLDQWLERPDEMAPPGMCRPFRGLRSEAARRALIAYMKNPAE